MRLSPEQKKAYRRLLESCRAREDDLPAIHEAVSKIDCFSQSNAPRFLFRYRPPNEYSFSDLENRELTFAHPSVFSDKEDADPKYPLDQISAAIDYASDPDSLKSFLVDTDTERLIDLLGTIEAPIDQELAKLLIRRDYKSISDKLAKESSHMRDNLARLTESIKNARRDAVRIACLTDNPRNMRMWDEYAVKHTGFMLVYATDDIRRCNLTNSLRTRLLPVLYDDNPFRTDAEFAWGAIRAAGAKIVHDDVFFSYRIVYRKRESLEWEEEWRASITPEQNELTVKHIQRPCPAVAIVLGSQISAEHAECCTASASQLGIPVLQEREWNSVLAQPCRS